jgi:phosphopantetheinyl transferase
MSHPPLCCRYASLAELPPAEPRAAAGWLSTAEHALWEQLRHAERRATFLAGRILAKQMLNEYLSVAPAEIHIDSRSARAGHGERPAVLAGGRRLDWALSIAHTTRGVLVALGREPGVTLGVDLVARDEPHAHIAWTLTPGERRALAAGRSLEQLWAMKEAVYKACQQGEGFAPARIEVTPQISYRAPGATRVVRHLQSWRVDRHVAALAVAAAA